MWSTAQEQQQTRYKMQLTRQGNEGGGTSILKQFPFWSLCLVSFDSLTAQT
jgi:hypothetical protein